MCRYIQIPSMMPSHAAMTARISTQRTSQPPSEYTPTWTFTFRENIYLENVVELMNTPCPHTVSISGLVQEEG